MSLVGLVRHPQIVDAIDGWEDKARVMPEGRARDVLVARALFGRQVFKLMEVMFGPESRWDVIPYAWRSPANGSKSGGDVAVKEVLEFHLECPPDTYPARVLIPKFIKGYEPFYGRQRARPPMALLENRGRWGLPKQYLDYTNPHAGGVGYLGRAVVTVAGQACYVDGPLSTRTRRADGTLCYNETGLYRRIIGLRTAIRGRNPAGRPFLVERKRNRQGDTGGGQLGRLTLFWEIPHHEDYYLSQRTFRQFLKYGDTPV